MSIALDREQLFSGHREAFGKLTQPQVDGLNALADGMQTDPLLFDVRHAAYMLATTWHETAKTMQPVAERGDRRYFDARYDPVRANTAQRRARARAMGNAKEGDGFRFRGRGYVQLTWRNNYARAGQALGIDLEGTPELAMQPGFAYQIMSRGMHEGWFTGKRLSDYIHGGQADFVRARQIINGMDRASDVAAYANTYLGILTAAAIKPALPADPEPSSIPLSSLPIAKDAAGIRALQRALGVQADGVLGPDSYRAIINRVRA